MFFSALFFEENSAVVPHLAAPSDRGRQTSRTRIVVAQKRRRLN